MELDLPHLGGHPVKTLGCGLWTLSWPGQCGEMIRPPVAAHGPLSLPRLASASLLAGAYEWHRGQDCPPAADTSPFRRHQLEKKKGLTASRWPRLPGGGSSNVCAGFAKRTGGALRLPRLDVRNQTRCARANCPTGSPRSARESPRGTRRRPPPRRLAIHR